MELIRMNAAVGAALSRTVAHPASTSSGLRKIPPPTPVSPDNRPMPAPIASASGTGGGPVTSRALTFDVIVSVNSRTAEYSSTAPTSAPNHATGRWMRPPTNAIGTEVAANGRKSRQLNPLARVNLYSEMDETATFITSAVGRMMTGATPTSP